MRDWTLYCTVLYCTALYCTVLYCTALYCTALYCTVLYCTVLDVVPRCGLQVEDVTRLALEGCLRAEQGPSLVTVRRLFRTLGFLLGYNANVDDKHRSQMQDVVRSAAS